MICRVFSPLDYLFSVQIWSLKDEIMILSLFLGLSLTLFTPRSTYHSPHLTPYTSSSLLECPFHLFVAFKIISSFLHLGVLGKGSSVRWQMGEAQGIKGVKIWWNKYLVSKSMFHHYWGFCNLEISKIYTTCLLSAIFLSLSFFCSLLASISEIQIGMEYAVGI